MTSSHEPPERLHPGAAAADGRAAADPDVLRRLADQLHASITQAFDDLSAEGNATVPETRPEPPRFARPVSAPPVRMEQLARTPEPTADLDDLVDLLVPRLVEQLVPALRAALRDDV